MESSGVLHEGLNIPDDVSCGASLALLVADPLLGGLADNRRPTATESLGHRSPALNAGVDCSVAVNQRYVARDAHCDVGAFEFTDFAVVTIAIDPSMNVDPADGSALVTGTVKCSRAGDQFGLRVQLKQEQKSGKTSTFVQGEGGTAVSCTTSAQPWSAAAVPTAGAFVGGATTATASTNNTSIWVTPTETSRSVKLDRPRK